MDPLEQIKITFFQECQELMADLETGLLTLQAGEGDSETINAVFRAVHSVKGGAGAFGLEDLVRFAHVFETTLDEMRTGRLAADDVVVKTMLRAADMLADHVAAAQGNGATDVERSEALVAELVALTQETPAPTAAPVVVPDFEPATGADEFGFTPMQVSIEAPLEAFDFTPPAAAGWRVRFAPKASMYAKANDATPLLRELERLGPCAVQLDTDALPAFDAMDAEGAYAAWTVELTSDCAREAIAEVFEFVDGDCDLSIEPMAGASAAPEPELDIEAMLA
ncbi:MAG TPA: Hpt domain-containing protein, partial [Caulobacteraceae bacterium]|nr:Hpt domain-containing protein [Caulobacteraceae bacterium]